MQNKRLPVLEIKEHFYFNHLFIFLPTTDGTGTVNEVYTVVPVPTDVTVCPVNGASFDW